MMYLPVDSVEYANGLSKALLDIQFPIPHPSSTATGYCDYVIHPVSGAIACRLIEEDIIRININADKHRLDGLLIPAIALGLIEESVMINMQNLIDTKRGKEIRILETLPDFWRLQLFNDEQADVDGWFPKDE